MSWISLSVNIHSLFSPGSEVKPWTTGGAAGGARVSPCQLAAPVVMSYLVVNFGWKIVHQISDLRCN